MSGIEDNDEYYRELNEYRRRVKESDGFDIEGIRTPQGMSGWMPFNCQGLYSGVYPYGPLVNRYAKLGLHRYNMKEGANFELHALIKFNMQCNGACTFLITLEARDTVTRRPVQIFQVRVDEHRCGLLYATCTIARIKGETTDGLSIPQSVCGFPDWPSDDSVFNDREQFYLVERSELKSTHWIRLYLELTVYSKDKGILDEDLSKLEIVKVAIKTADEPPLKAKSSVLYIAFKGLARNGTGEELERKAIIKSVFNEQTGSLSLMGDLCKGEDDVTPMSLEEMFCQLSRQSLRHLARLRESD